MTWVQTVGVSAANTSPISATYSTTPTAGNLLTCGLIDYNAPPTNPFTVSDTATNTWTGLYTTDNGSGDGSLAIYYAWNCLTHASNQVTAASTTGFTSGGGIVVSEYSGIQNTSDPLNAHNATGGGPTSTTLTGVTAGSTIVFISTTDSTSQTACTIGGVAGTLRATNFDNFAVSAWGDGVSAGGGTVTVTTTPTDPSSSNMLAAAFTSAGGSSTPAVDAIFYGMNF